MKLKKVIAMAAVIMLPLLNVNVNAKELTDGTGTMEVTYGVTEGYVITIPDSVNFSNDTLTVEGEVKASNVIIPDGKSLKVSLVSANGFKLLYSGSEIVYTLKNGETEVASGDTVLTVLAGSTGLAGSTKLTFSTTTENIAAATKSGAHTDTLTFTAVVE